MEKIKANAKLNLGLNICGVLENGYHELEMIMVPITLSDNLIIKKNNHLDNKGELKLTSNNPDLPLGEKNILTKIYNAFFEVTKLSKVPLEVFLEKKIPQEAGLGGGSADGGFFLNYLNKLSGYPLSEEKLVKLSKNIGADIPFFIFNKPAYTTGIGENLTFIKNNLETKLILVKPSFGVSTKEAFKLYNNNKNLKKANLQDVQKALKNNDLKLLEKSIENNLEELLLKNNMGLRQFKEELEGIAKKRFFMSGSGSTFFTFIEANEQSTLYKTLVEKKPQWQVLPCDFL